jgi:hypothetical protein
MEELLGSVIPGGALVAIGVAIGAAFGKQLRPIAKQALKAGMVVGDQVRVAASEAAERAQDLVAEARAERETQLQHENGQQAKPSPTPRVKSGSSAS